MSTIRVDEIVDALGTGTPNFPNGIVINNVPLREGILDPENRIINGAFDFWQRGTSFTASAYGADRWLNTNAGGTVTQSRQAFTLGETFGTNNPTYFLRQTVSGQSLSTQYGLVQQPIEGVRSYAGQTITVLGWARRSSGSGNMTVEGLQFFGSGGSPSSSVEGIGATTVTLTSSWVAFAVTMSVPSITGKTLGTAGNDQLVINFWTSAGSTFNARTNSLGIQTIGVDLWGIHIKVGTHTTDAVSLYKQPELGPELARCQRYYEVGSARQNIRNPSFGDNHPFGSLVGTHFQVSKRAVPTVTLGTATASGCYTNSGSTENINTSGFTQTLLTLAGGAATNMTITQPWTAEAEI